MNDSIEDIIKKNTTNKDCEYYNWGGDVEKGYPNYPLVYGPRCEHYGEFFYRSVDNILTPSCYECEYFIEW